MEIVLIYSGGMDSTTLLYHLRSGGHNVHCLLFDYGQRHRRELRAAQEICDSLGVEREYVDLRSINHLLAGSSQTDQKVAVPEGHYTDETMKATVVPNRNMIMLSMAVGWAVSRRFEAVAYACHAGDHAIYPDCRPDFVEALQIAVWRGNYRGVKVLAPFIYMSKGEIVKLGAKLGVPFEKTYSCYKGEKVHCAHCGTCTERREAFQLAGIPDPTVYG